MRKSTINFWVNLMRMVRGITQVVERLVKDRAAEDEERESAGNKQS